MTKRDLPQIRVATQDDLDDLYRVCLLTGDLGEDATHHFSYPRLIGDIYVVPYVILNSGVGFVVVDEEGVGGYCVGTADTQAFEQECELHWWPPLREHYPDQGPDTNTEEGWHLDFVHRPQITPEEIVADYSAHFHISLLPRLQGRGLGRAVLTRLKDEVRSLGAKGLHLGVETDNTRAIGFYHHLGFTTIATHHDDLIMAIYL